MAAYKALTLCRFGGKDYRPGETIPAGAFPEKQAAELALMGLIEIKKAAKKKPAADFTEVNKIVETTEPEETPAPVEEPEAEAEEPEQPADEQAKPRRRSRRKAARE